MTAMASHRPLGATELARGFLVNRRRPELESIARETDPERFIWRVLPHAARSFAASIAVLPPDQARAAAVAYLYCRMLDTYEDLIDDPAASISELRRFAARFDFEEMTPPPAIPPERARDDRDLVYLLLISRCELVDAVFGALPPDVRARIRELVQEMAEGMVWSTDAFSRQGGVLVDEDQLALYCRHVIGHPAMFVVHLIGVREVTEPIREDTLLASEMIQLANVSRDIEHDLARGIAYHPALKPHLGRTGYERETVPVVREVRQEFMLTAMSRAPAYRRLFEGLGLRRNTSVRTAAVLMLLFTDLHYRSCAVRTGHKPWPGPRGRLQVVAEAVSALVSPRRSSQIVRRVERNFRSAAAGLSPVNRA